MAFRRRARVITRSPRKERRWTANIDSRTVTMAAQEGFDVVTPADYEQAATLEQSGVTLARIRGTVNFTVTSFVATDVIVWAAIFPHDEDFGVTGGAFIPNSAQSAIDEDYLWWKSAILVPDLPSVSWDIDIKAMRKLNNHGVGIAWICTGSTDTVAEVSNLRALLLGG